MVVRRCVTFTLRHTTGSSPTLFPASCISGTGGELRWEEGGEGGGRITGAAGPPPIWNNGSILLPGVPGPGSVGMLGIPGLHGGSGSRPSRPASQTLITCPPAAYHFKIMRFQERRAAMVQNKKIKQRLVLSSSGGVGESGWGWGVNFLPLWGSHSGSQQDQKHGH